jgi:hypothetical protein
MGEVMLSSKTDTSNTHTAAAGALGKTGSNCSQRLPRPREKALRSTSRQDVLFSPHANVLQVLPTCADEALAEHRGNPTLHTLSSDFLPSRTPTLSPEPRHRNRIRPRERQTKQDRERKKERETGRDRKKDRKTERERETETERAREKARDIQKETVREKETETENVRERDRVRQRQREGGRLHVVYAVSEEAVFIT